MGGLGAPANGHASTTNGEASLTIPTPSSAPKSGSDAISILEAKVKDM